MRPAFAIAYALFMSFPFSTPAWSQTARDFCPEALTTDCLQAVADHLIEKQPEGRARASMAVEYARQIAALQPDKAMALIRANGFGADETSLRILADFMTEQGQEAAAREILLMARQTRVDDPRPDVKVLDLLYTAGEMAKAGHLDLTKETQIIAAGFLPGDAGDFVPFSEELRLARLMGLYGWPEESEPWFTAAYDRMTEIPEGSFNRGFTLARFMGVARIIGNTALAERAARDLAAFYETAAPEVKQQVRSSEVIALAESGQVAEAKSKAKAYGITLVDTLANSPGLFLDQETDYVPGMFSDTRDRYEQMAAALETDAAKGVFLTALARKLIYQKLYAEVETLLPRVTDPAARSSMVLELMTYFAREKNEPARAADLYFSELVNLTPRSVLLGTFLERYPLALTAEGLWESGDFKRAETLTATVLDLWLADQSEDRDVHLTLISAMAQAGQDRLIAQWLDAAPLPKDRIDTLEWAARGRAQKGDFDGSQNYLSQAEAQLVLLSNDPPVPPSWWPKDRPMPSEREAAAGSLVSGSLFAISEMARQNLYPLIRQHL